MASDWIFIFENHNVARKQTAFDFLTWRKKTTKKRQQKNNIAANDCSKGGGVRARVACQRSADAVQLPPARQIHHTDPPKHKHKHKHLPLCTIVNK